MAPEGNSGFLKLGLVEGLEIVVFTLDLGPLKDGLESGNIDAEAVLEFGTGGVEPGNKETVLKLGKDDLEPCKAGLGPGKAGLGPGNAGLGPGKDGFEPGKAGLEAEITFLDSFAVGPFLW